MSIVYVCYERNYSDLAVEAGPVNDVTVFDSPELSCEWVKNQIQKGVGDGYVVQLTVDISDKAILKKINKCGYFSVELYDEYQENYNREYDIVVERKEVQAPEEKKESENYKKFKKILAENISVEAMEEYWLGNPDDMLKANVEDIILKIKTEKNCPKCGATLCLSDLPQYDYVCTLCDESFYECEVKSDA